MVTTGKRINKMSCALYPHAPQSAQPGTFQVEAEDLKLSQEKRVSYLTWSLAALQPISHAHLGIFQATPIGTILPLWEKCNIWLVKLTITSAADNQGKIYLLIIPVRSRKPKILHELHCWISQKTPALGRSMAPFHPSQPIFPLQYREQRAVVCSQGLLKPSAIPSTSVLCWSVTTILQRQQKAWWGLGHFSSLGRNGLQLTQSLGCKTSSILT